MDLPSVSNFDERVRRSSRGHRTRDRRSSDPYPLNPTPLTLPPKPGNNIRDKIDRVGKTEDAVTGLRIISGHLGCSKNGAITATRPDSQSDLVKT